MRALLLVGLMCAAACAESSGLAEKERAFTSRSEEKRAPEGLETFTTSKTTKAMFKREGLVKLQRKLADELPSLRRAEDAGLPDSGVKTSVEAPEELELTGTLDEPTQRALSAWQHGEGLAETGLPDYQTLERLGIEPSEVFHHKPAAAKPET
jgi:hypothetical protein